MIRGLLVRAGACLVLALLDRAFATLAIDINATGALISPQGVQLDALVVAGGFLACRLLLAVVFCAAVARTAFDLVGALFARGSGDAEGAA